MSLPFGYKIRFVKDEMIKNVFFSLTLEDIGDKVDESLVSVVVEVDDQGIVDQTG